MSTDMIIICLACYKDRLASVCDNAEEYKLFEIRENQIYPAGHLSLPSKDPMDRTSAILARGVAFLLCGAICREFRTRLEEGGVKVLSLLTGPVEAVLQACSEGRLDRMAMPGSTVSGDEKIPLSDSAI